MGPNDISRIPAVARVDAVKKMSCYSLQSCNDFAKWISRGVITAVLKWRGRSSVERAAANLSLGSKSLISVAIPTNH